MGRGHRVDIGGQIYHVLNRANDRKELFARPADYADFENVLTEAKERYATKVFSYNVMPNHWHLVVSPQNDGGLSKFTGWLTLTHTQRWHSLRDTIGHGHLYQGRYKSFLCEDSDHFLTLVRYVERNPVRAGLVGRSEEWRWSSAWRRKHGSIEEKGLLSDWPVPIRDDYSSFLNEPQTMLELEALRHSAQRGNPFGSAEWAAKAITRFGLEATLRPRGRPRKGS